MAVATHPVSARCPFESWGAYLFNGELCPHLVVIRSAIGSGSVVSHSVKPERVW